MSGDRTLFVTGTIASIPYRVGIHPAPIEGEPYGCVMGSTHATTLLCLHVGELVQQTPTHEAVRLALDDPASVLAALHALTSVAVVEGLAQPEGAGLIPGAIY